MSTSSSISSSRADRRLAVSAVRRLLIGALILMVLAVPTMVFAIVN